MLEKKQNNRIILVIIMILHGVSIMIKYIPEMINQKPYVIYSIEYSSYLHFIGIFLGLLLILSGLGIYYKKIATHYLALSIYVIFGIWIIVWYIIDIIKYSSLSSSSFPLLLTILIIGYIAVMIYFIHKSKVKIQKM
jgi:hypothetical protein